ncbi:hypothetical protein [Massilia soli]|uniref:Uncharacterized protein n=1 Tax=Massilia soli TaxID=2792854 RepID=A0ABS7SUM7_9BURK|nr:hypothetical protein [Massilia soli]MBZ2209644.1 hypothetical protein [Massilia soli]
MTNYVYIALDGLRKSPISEEAWLSAVGQCEDLVIDPTASSRRSAHVVRLRTDRRATLRLDRFGIAAAASPSKELIAAMFKVASVLNASVYSEHFNRYRSPDEWMLRRTLHRRAFDQQRAYKEARKDRLWRMLLWLAVCAAAALAGFLLGTLYVTLRP